MVRLLVIIPVFIFSCRNEKSNAGVDTLATDTTIQLIDSLGSISLQFPNKADTFFSWIRTNDCGRPCEEGKYRFQPKHLRIFKESGFFRIGQPEDSVNQLTISHSRRVQGISNLDAVLFNLHGHFKENLLADPETVNIISDTIERISDRLFSIYKISAPDKNKGVHKRHLIAYTIMKGNIVAFRYDLLTRNNDRTLNEFFDKAKENLQTVRIKDGD